MILKDIIQNIKAKMNSNNKINNKLNPDKKKNNNH